MLHLQSQRHVRKTSRSSDKTRLSALFNNLLTNFYQRISEIFRHIFRKILKVSKMPEILKKI